MPLSAQKQRERRAAQRAAEAQDAARGQPKPRGPNPTGCYWDPRPGELTGTWRELLTHKVSQQQNVRAMQRFGARRRRVPLVRGPLRSARWAQAAHRSSS